MAFGTALLARLGLDTAGFKTGLAGAESALDHFAGKIGIALSVAGIEEFSRGIIEYGARVYDLGQRFGVATDIIQQFGNAAEKNGSSMEGMTMGFNKLEIAQARALAGNTKITEAFANLGITLDQLKTLSPDQLMLALGKSSLNAADLVTVLGRSALQLRPLLRGLADGSIELGEAIDSGMIKKLKEADKAWKSFFEGLRVVSAGVLTQIMDEVRFLGAGIAGMFGGLRDAAVADFRGIAAAATFNFGEAKRQAELAKKAMEDFAHAAFDPAKRPGAATTTAPKPFGLGDEEAGGPNKASEAAARKLRERNQLSLEDLAKGPGYGAQNQASLQAIYASEQARKVKEMEEQAQKLRTQQADYVGANRVQDAADTLRQSIGGLKESEKEVGVYTKTIDDSATGKAVQAIAQEFAEDRG